MSQQPEEPEKKALNDREFSALMEEYRALRTEIIHLMVSRNTVLGFYFTGLLLSAGFIATLINSKDLQDFKFFILIFYFSLVIPNISLFALEFWFSESLRGYKAALYIHEFIEKKVNSMNWEGLNVNFEKCKLELNDLFSEESSTIWEKVERNYIKDLDSVRNLLFQISLISIGLSFCVLYKMYKMGLNNGWIIGLFLILLILVSVWLLRKACKLTKPYMIIRGLDKDSSSKFSTLCINLKKLNPLREKDHGAQNSTEKLPKE